MIFFVVTTQLLSTSPLGDNVLDTITDILIEV